MGRLLLVGERDKLWEIVAIPRMIGGVSKALKERYKRLDFVDEDEYNTCSKYKLKRSTTRTG